MNATNTTQRSETMTSKNTGWIARGRINNKVIVCTDGEKHPETMVGPGGWSAKVWKTRTGAAKHGTPEKI